MKVQMAMSSPRAATVAGLLAGTLGIGILWVSGVAFPFVIPPGFVILLVGALVIALAKWRWAPAVGAFLGLFVFVGFLISPSGVPNLLGQNGMTVAIGQGIQVIGVLTALIGGVMATWTTYQTSTQR